MSPAGLVSGYVAGLMLAEQEEQLLQHALDACMRRSCWRIAAIRLVQGPPARRAGEFLRIMPVPRSEATQVFTSAQHSLCVYVTTAHTVSWDFSA